MGFFADGFFAQSFWADQFFYSTGVAVVGGSGNGKKKKYVYIERDGKIYLFPNASQAAIWTQQQREAETQQEVAIPGEYKPVSKRKQVEPEIIYLSALSGLLVRYQTDYTDLDALIAAQEFGALIALQNTLRKREEDEIIILLMAA